MKRLSLTFLGIFTFISINAFSQSPVNIYESFEGGVIPQGWNLTGFFIDNTLNHTQGGTYSARSSQGAPPQNNYLRSPKFSVLAGENIVITFFAQRTGGGQNPWANVRIKGTNFDFSFDTTIISNTSWQQFRYEVGSISTTDSVAIYFYCNTNPGSQRAIFDDISIEKSVILPGAPSAPTALSAIANSFSTINLNWTDNSTNESAFIIERKMQGEPSWSFLDSVPQNTTSYTDNGLNSNTVYHYRVYANNNVGQSPYSNEANDTTFTLTTITGNSNAPDKFNLYNNYPNPFNPSTKIKFDIPASNGNSNVGLSIFDMSGREVSTLINRQLSPGSYEFEFDAKDLTSGIYFYRLTMDNFVATKKMVLVK